MPAFSSVRTTCLASVALAGLALLTNGATAQTIRIFEEAPSIEQLRSIIIPESRGGATRSIVMLGGGPVRNTNVVQAAADLPAAAPEQERAAPVSAAPSTAPLSAPVAAASTPRAAGPAAGIVGFRINFALDSAAVPDTASDSLDRMAELLRQEPQVKLRVEGHTDARGSADYNQNLSERRAAAVADYLVRHAGISADRLVVEGKGMSEPITQDAYYGRNRRVQFVRMS